MHNPFAALITPAQPPAWKGPKLRHRLQGEPRTGVPPRWKPWTLLNEQTERSFRFAGDCWPLIKPANQPRDLG